MKLPTACELFLAVAAGLCGCAAPIVVKRHNYNYNGRCETQISVFAGGQWYVAKGSETFTLNNFVKSGRFCGWSGRHEWVGGRENMKERGLTKPWIACEGEICLFCHRCRRKIKVAKEAEEWEP